MTKPVSAQVTETIKSQCVNLYQCLRRRASHTASHSNSITYGNADSGASARKVTKRHCHARSSLGRGCQRAATTDSSGHLLLLFCSSHCFEVMRQRKPMCEAPLSGVQPIRALGR